VIARVIAMDNFYNHLPHVINSRCMDLKMVCFKILIVDLPILIGLMARPVNLKISIKDNGHLNTWLYIIFKFVVIKIHHDNDLKSLIISQLTLLRGLTPKVLGAFFIKTASKQPLFKARWILQTWSLF
jgi:hypothetical protein